MLLPLYQVDAFARRPFTGNPAAVCPLPAGADWPAAGLMQHIAAENNLAETAFFRPGAARPAEFDLRWFTPTAEIDLCGHATLASAHVLFQHLDYVGESITFHTLSGPLHVRREAADGRLTLDSPSRPPRPLPRGPSGRGKTLPRRYRRPPSESTQPALRRKHPDLRHRHRPLRNPRLRAKRGGPRL